MKTINKVYLINAPTDEIWHCLTDEKVMEEWGAGPAKFEVKKHGKINMWGDYLTGKVRKITKNKIIEQDWLVDGMQEPSIVLFELLGDDNSCTVKLTHSQVPDELFNELAAGWDEYYLGAIKDYLEGK